MTTPDFDVVVVGARVAGASTAMLLAKHGQRVLLLDRARLPSEIAQGHFVYRHGRPGSIGTQRSVNQRSRAINCWRGWAALAHRAGRPRANVRARADAGVLVLLLLEWRAD